MDRDSSSRAQRVAGFALGVTLLLAAAKVAAWAVTGSLALLSQALDSVVDIVALGLAFVAVRIARKPADASHHYGHGKAENLAAFTQTLILAVIVVGVVIESVSRLAAPPADVSAPAFAIALMVVSLVVDGLRAQLLARAAVTERSDALRAGALNFAGDVGTAIVALVALVLVNRDVERADEIGALIVAALVLAACARLGKRSVDVLMDRAPVAPLEAIAAATTAASGVAETRRVRVRGSEQQLFADVTVAAGRTASLERAHDIAERVEREIQRAAPGTDVVVHVEPATEASGVVERVQAAASRTEGVHEVHNVSVHSFGADRRRLHVTLHAKVDHGVSLEQAHALSDAIEESVSQELGHDVRVDTHIEPLADPTAGRDVKSARSDLADAVRRAAVAEPDILDCHEVLVTASGDQVSIVAHVRGRADLPLARIHEASTRIENTLRAEHHEIVEVLIHFEPGASSAR
jgi:cation diffusion facilitator family transporter